MYLKFLLILVLTFILSACGITPKYNKVEVESVKIVKQTIPDEFLATCKTEPLISKKDYLDLELHRREQYLTEYIIALFGNISSCNNQISKIRELSSK